MRNQRKGLGNTDAVGFHFHFPLLLYSFHRMTLIVFSIFSNFCMFF
jgi:hypothetical protein